MQFEGQGVQRFGEFDADLGVQSQRLVDLFRLHERSGE
jgi:hypothetical protein